MKRLLLGWLALFYCSLTGELTRAQEGAGASGAHKVDVASSTAFLLPTLTQNAEPYEANGYTRHVPYSSSLFGASNAANKVTFYTLDIGELQFGASFTPNTGQESDISLDHRHHPMGRIVSFDTGVDSTLYSPTFDPNHQAYSLILRHPIGELGLSLGASLVTPTQAKDRETHSLNHNKMNSYNVGATISWKGFDLAAGFYDNKKTGVRNPESLLGREAGKAWNVEGGYSWGEYAFAVGYLKGKRNTTVATTAAAAHGTNTAKAEIYSLTADWRIAEGLTVYGDLNYARMKNPTTQNRDDKSAKSETKGTVFLLGTRVNF